MYYREMQLIGPAIEWFVQRCPDCDKLVKVRADENAGENQPYCVECVMKTVHARW